MEFREKLSKHEEFDRELTKVWLQRSIVYKRETVVTKSRK